MKRSIFFLFLLHAFIFSACATSSSHKQMSAKDEARFSAAIEKADTENPPEIQVGDTLQVSIGESAARDAATTPAPVTAPTPAREFTVSKADYDTFFAQSPAVILGRLTLNPLMDGTTLLGYRIQDIKKFEGVDLQKEDIIVGINDKMPRTPDAYFEAWQTAKTMGKCTVNIQRGTDRFDLVWNVAE